MENGFILQLLVTAGVIAYGVWSAVQKSNKQAHEQPNRDGRGGDVSEKEMTWDDYFPSSSMDMSTQSESVDEPLEVRVDKTEKAKRNQATRKNEDNYHLATSSIEVPNGSTQDIEEDPLLEYGRQEAVNTEVVTDLKTIIISSELLKPKYLEY